MEKYVQIYNPTSQTIDLSAYTLVVKMYSNGNKPVAGDHAESRIALTGSLAPNATIVLRQKDAKIYTDGIVATFSFNGNDALALMKGTQLIDHLGHGMDNPWMDGRDNGGKDVILHRKVSVTAPSASFVEDQWERIPLTKDNQEATIKQYLGKR